MPTESIRFVDTTLRDGNQSLWGAVGITTPMVLTIAPVIDRVGFHVVEFITSTHMAVSVRRHRENPWERIRLTKELMPNTPLGFLTTGMRFVTWERTPEPVMELALRVLARNGITRFWVADPMNDVQSAVKVAEMIKKAGGQDVVVGLVYTVSPVHTDDFYADRARLIRESPHVDGAYIKDVDGLLTPERVNTLVPRIHASLGDLPLEMHAHCNTGLAPLCYLEAIRRGVGTLHTAISPLANGTSQPSTENTLRNVRQLGFTADLDVEALTEMATFFEAVARQERLPIGVPPEYDAGYYRHQVPGGMLSTLKRQLLEIHQEHRLDEVLEEVVAVREDLGSPIMMTPFSQFVATQALLNVVGGERYAQVPDEVIGFALGQFGQPQSPIQPEVLDRILGSSRARELAQSRPDPSITELRQKLGGALSDEELLLRIVLPAEQVEGMLAAGPAPRAYSIRQPVTELIRGVATRKNVTYFQVEKGSLRLTIEAGAH
jgi:oxaloacetate decarboxylase (Na+ extruding) subunit alpha